MKILDVVAAFFFGIALGLAGCGFILCHYDHNPTANPVFSLGGAVLVFDNGQPLYDGRVTGTTEDGQYVKVGDETTLRWPENYGGLRYWRSVKHVKHLSPKPIDLGGGH